ncbi:MAG: hypothetical protein EU536_01925 [Promethearchaeota archaeon]|nr:MAG: hypothetical protein EU536_01925 [Candidatus Lokiarchaeota archaeon]
MLLNFEKNLKLEIDATYLPELLKNLYIKNTASRISTAINAEELSSKLIKRSKQMLDDGQIQEAQSLISKARTIPQKIVETLKLADESFQKEEYSIAATYYESISKLLFEIDETALMQQYHEKAEKIKKIPILFRERKDFVENANKNLKKVDFSTAIEWFTAAAKHSEQLEDKVKFNEYNKKAKALEAFLEAEREAKLQDSEVND